MTWGLWWTILIVALIAWLFVGLYLAPLWGQKSAERRRKQWVDKHGQP